MHAEGRGRGGERKRERKDACWWRGKIAPLKETVAKQSHNASRIINIPYRQRSKLNLSTLSRTRKSKSLPFLFPKIKDFSRNYNRNRYLTAALVEARNLLLTRDILASSYFFLSHFCKFLTKKSKPKQSNKPIPRISILLIPNSNSRVSRSGDSLVPAFK